MELDKLIADYLCQKYNLEPSDKLLQIAAFLKKGVSLNQKVEHYCETQEMNFCLNRDEYLKITENYWNNIPDLIDEVDAIEIVGGNIRSYRFLETLNEKVSKYSYST